jgi:hypothetical protein
MHPGNAVPVKPSQPASHIPIPISSPARPYPWYTSLSLQPPTSSPCYKSYCATPTSKPYTQHTSQLLTHTHARARTNISQTHTRHAISHHPSPPPSHPPITSVIPPTPPPPHNPPSPCRLPVLCGVQCIYQSQVLGGKVVSISRLRTHDSRLVHVYEYMRRGEDVRLGAKKRVRQGWAGERVGGCLTVPCRAVRAWS